MGGRARQLDKEVWAKEFELEEIGRKHFSDALL